MSAAGKPVSAGGGAVRVWLPAGEALRDVEGIGYWSPDPELGRFTVIRGEAGDGEALLAAARSRGELELERDERAERGGLVVRRLRYRERARTPRDVVDRGAAGRATVGGEEVEQLIDVLLVADADGLLRVGYSVRTDAPAALRETFAQILDGVRVGGEP